MTVLVAGGFLIAVLPLVATPGASLTLLVQRVTDRGVGQCGPVIAGTVTGLYTHAGLAAVGLSALVMRSSQLYTVVRLVGAGYLVGLGIWMWRGSTGARSADRGAQDRDVRERGSTYRQALLVNVLNPKAASIYLTLVPQFVDPGGAVTYQILLLATAHAVLIAAWLVGWTVVLARVGRAVRSARFAAIARRTCGVVLVALGLRAAISTG
ncbi:LysE family translocator [Plantactinospora sp. GCM10030261]|uniref:LysE family translocator n=1 Tax=Plantactinospora sp. GCM10030261 TaxID=3273420 RepID=UPI003608AD1D